MYKRERWSDETILTVWQMGQVASGYDSKKYRRDACGAWMEFNEHGNRNAIRGWEIDHITPESHGGSDILSNLQPLNWKNNVEKGDSSQLKCAVRN